MLASLMGLAAIVGRLFENSLVPVLVAKQWAVLKGMKCLCVFVLLFHLALMHGPVYVWRASLAFH